MKKLLLSLSIVALMFSCKSEPKDYATVSGKVTNIDVPVDSISIFNPKNDFVKHIKLNEDGTFKDTLKVEDAMYVFQIGNEYGRIFLKNNDEINLTTDYPQFDETLKFEGEGENVDNSNLAVEAMLYINKYSSNNELNEALRKSESEQKKFIAGFDSILAKYNVDEDFKEEVIKTYKEYLKQELEKQAIRDKFIGKPAPEFSMEDINGKNVSLSDLKGKPIYIDIWATWCGPCKAEIPSLKKLEEEYGDKIEFVSISVDEPDHKDKWKDFVAKEDLKGYQLTTGEGWKSQFVRELGVNGIPRFVLIDKQGNIIDPDAPRPSSQKISEILKELSEN